MNVVERMLIALIGEEAAIKIIEHPNLHVLSLPANVIDDLQEGTFMVVPVGKLCDLCDLPEANKFCQCEVEIVETPSYEGIKKTIKSPRGDRVVPMRGGDW